MDSILDCQEFTTSKSVFFKVPGIRKDKKTGNRKYLIILRSTNEKCLDRAMIVL